MPGSVRGAAGNSRPYRDHSGDANEVIESSGNGTSRVLSRLIGSLSLLVAIFSPIEISQFPEPVAIEDKREMKLEESQTSA
jgi:hypothetical protein